MKTLVLTMMASSVALGTVVLSAGETRQKVTLNVSGAVWGNCAKALAAALVQGGVEKASKIAPNKGKGPVAVTGEIISDADLATIAKAINATKTPHRDQSPPGLSLVLFAKLNQESSIAARKALAKVKGVSPKGTRANAKKGQISVKISGEAKISTATILTALKDAGIEASISPAKE